MSLAPGAQTNSSSESSPAAIEFNTAPEELRPLLWKLNDLGSTVESVKVEMARVYQVNPSYLSTYIVPYSGMSMIFYIVQRLCKTTNAFDQAEKDCAELLTTLLKDFGANPSFLDGVMKQTPLYYAARAGSVVICELLVRTLGASARIIDIHNQTPLYYASREGKIETVEWLVKEGGCEVNHVDKNGQTALFYAAREDRCACVIKLVNELGADPLIRDVYKKRARGYLKSTVQKDTYEFLSEIERIRDPNVAAHSHRKLFLVRPDEPVGAAAMTLRQHKAYNPYEQDDSVLQVVPTAPPKRQRSSVSGTSTPAAGGTTGRNTEKASLPPSPAPVATTTSGRSRYRVKAPLGKGGLEEFEKQFPEIAAWSDPAKRAAAVASPAGQTTGKTLSRPARAPIASLTPPWVSVVSQLLRGPLWRYGPATIFHKPVLQMPTNLGPKYAPTPGEPEKKLAIDLSVIRKKLEKGKYLRLTEVDRDVRSMFSQALVLAEGPTTNLGLLTKATEVYYEQQMAGSGLAAVLRKENEEADKVHTGENSSEQHA